MATSFFPLRHLPPGRRCPLPAHPVAIPDVEYGHDAAPETSPPPRSLADATCTGPSLIPGPHAPVANSSPSMHRI